MECLPHAVVEIEDGGGFGCKGGMAGEDPASMLPGAEGIAAEPAPRRSAADLGDETLRNHVLPDLVDRETGRREPEAVRECTGYGAVRRGDAGGKVYRVAIPILSVRFRTFP